MKRSFIRVLSSFLLGACCLSATVQAQSLDDFTIPADPWHMARPIQTSTAFNGYTNHWQDEYKSWIRYGNLFKISIPDVGKMMQQTKIDVAEDMGLPGLLLQEGFMDGLLTSDYSFLNYPSVDEITAAAVRGSVLITADPASPAGKRIAAGIAGIETDGEKLHSHQYQGLGFKKLYAYYMQHNGRSIYVLLSSDTAGVQKMVKLITEARSVLKEYDMKKGLFGAETLLKSVTIMQGHPLEVIGKGMNEGDSWFVFSGYMEFLEKDELKDWIGKLGLPVVTDVGFSPIFGCKDYDGLQVQDMPTKQSWIDFAHKKGGYVFRPVYDPDYDPYRYDGTIAAEGYKEQVDNDNVPFVTTTGGMPDDLVNSMVLFIPRGQHFTREGMWDAIMGRRAVSVLGQGKIMGPERFRQAMELLFLDRTYLEGYFGDRVDMSAVMDNYTLQVTVMNNSQEELSGTLGLILPAGLRTAGRWDSSLRIAPDGARTIRIPVKPGKESMNTTNPIAVSVSWKGHTKTILTMLDLPPAISVHRLLYGLSPKVAYPVTIHNFSDKPSFPVMVEVIKKDKPGEIVYKDTKTCTTATGTAQKVDFTLQTPPGDYVVKVSALDMSYNSQLGVRRPEGRCYAYEVDLNNDGVKEIRMENDSVEVTLLATGARVIEYIVKSRKDNVFFKLWPDKASDDKRLFRKRGYYPYGGFEDFLGQGSMETHKVYDAQLVKKDGEYVQVKMSADYYGNRIEKTFTLFGNSPLLEVRYALTFVSPDANVIGPQPILELGKEHGPEDLFIVPDRTGMKELRMRPENYYGNLFHLAEGWNAGYDTKEDISFVGAYPVDQPLFLHMWMNHPRNSEAHYYYAEFQPWTPIFQKSTMYFSYYMWAAGGTWQQSLQAMRSRNLITEYK